MDLQTFNHDRWQDPQLLQARNSIVVGESGDSL